MNSWMKKLNRIGPDSTKAFKYIMPHEIYKIIDYTITREKDFLTEFFTDNPERSKIPHYLKDRGYTNVQMEYEPTYNCYSIEVIDPQIYKTLELFYDPYRYLGEEAYIQNALKLGYTNLDEIKKDFLEYHNRVGKQFQKDGLLPQEMEFKL